MDHIPLDWHDILAHHDFARDLQLRRARVEAGIYFFPAACKQASISAAHTEQDIYAILQAVAAISADWKRARQASLVLN